MNHDWMNDMWHRFKDLKSKKSSSVETGTLTNVGGFLAGDWQGNHIHFTSASNASLGAINWNAIAGEKMSRKERTAPIKSTSQQLNQILPASAHDWYERRLVSTRKRHRVRIWMNEQREAIHLSFDFTAVLGNGSQSRTVQSRTATSQLIVGRHRGAGLYARTVPRETVS